MAPTRRLSMDEALELMSAFGQISAAGLPLAEGLRVAAEETRDSTVSAVLHAMAEMLDQGKSLAETLHDSSAWLPGPVTGLVAAAARTGNFGEAVGELVEQQRSALSMKRSVGRGFMYPLLVACLAIVVLGTITAWGADAFRKMYAEFQLKVPLLTELLFWWRDVGIWMLLSAVIVGVLLVLVFQWRAGRAAWQRLTATLPLWGPLWHWLSIAEWCGVLSALLKYRMAVPAALRLSADGVTNEYVGTLSRELASAAEQGRDLSTVLTSCKAMPTAIVPLVRWGERTDMLAEAFATVRDLLFQRAQFRAAMLQAILPPIIFITIGCCVLLVIGGLFMPLYSLIEGLTG